MFKIFNLEKLRYEHYSQSLLKKKKDIELHKSLFKLDKSHFLFDEPNESNKEEDYTSAIIQSNIKSDNKKTNVLELSNVIYDNENDKEKLKKIKFELESSTYPKDDKIKKYRYGIDNIKIRDWNGKLYPITKDTFEMLAGKRDYVTYEDIQV